MGINAIIRVTEDCNLGCRYCYAARSSELQLMPDDVVDALVKDLAMLDVDLVKFIWHGGEPLLAPHGFYERVVARQKRAFGSDERFSNIIQVNGTLLTDETIAFLAENHFGVGVSLDGPPEIHDANRPYLDGGRSFADVWSGVARLLERGEDFGVLAVITQNSLPHAEHIFDFFVDHGIRTFGFLPYLHFEAGHLHPLAIDAAQYSGFLETMFLKWVALDDPAVNISNLYDCLDGLLGGRPYKCEASGTCLRLFFAINQAGDVFPCSRFVGEDDLCYGNILEQTLAELLTGSVVRGIEEARREAIDVQCRDCQWFAACQGGCLHYRFERRGRLLDPYYYCASKKRLFRAMSRWLDAELPRIVPREEWSVALPGHIVSCGSEV